MCVQRFDIAAFLRGILQLNVVGHRVHADVAEREVLRRRRLLHQERPFAVPEHGIAARPPDVDVLPEAGGQRRVDIVVQVTCRPLLVRLAR